VTVEFTELREKVLKLLEEGRAFECAVAEFTSLDWILKRLDKREE